ncbi:Lin1244/Lin1753 domain-containing protein [Bacteroides graminisolvens]|uniref:DUF7833 domain-containing protein n=1 Tax=Bacteroides graminisolvens TaxID=477666 RepID=UPI0029C7AC1D|nr:Lin1244/Lin1753 domain-containing protein [Bacteroides graminisolvens]
MEKNFYFKHDASAFSNAKLMNLVQKEGLSGYGIYWAILEFLRMQPEYSASRVTLSQLARKTNTTQKKMMRIISDYDLFVLTDDRFYSSGLFERMAAHDRVVGSCRANGRLGGLANSLKISQSDEANALALQRESNHIITPLKSESEANSCSSPEELLRTVAEMKHEAIWQEQMAMKSGMGLKFAAHFDALLLAFSTYISLIGEENSIPTVNDAKRRFFFWMQSADCKQLMARLQRQEEAAPDPYRFETIVDGRRTYCGMPIEEGAPPRPAINAVWDDDGHCWRH